MTKHERRGTYERRMWSRGSGLTMSLWMLGAAAVALLAYMFVTGQHTPQGHVLALATLMLSLLVLFSIHRLRTRRRREEVLACLAATTEAGDVTAICDAEDGRARIRGRVERVLRAPDESGCAAYLRRRVTMDVLETRDCGRFLVHDGTALAVIDPFSWQIARADGRLLPHTRDSALEIRPGDEVEIVADAHWIEAEDVGDVPVLCLDGNDVRPMVILLRQSA